MTDAEKIEQVEHALDGHAEFIAEARAGFQSVFVDRFFYFCTGCYDTKADKTDRYFTAELDRVLGAAATDKIYEEEQAKFDSRMQQQQEPEAWKVYRHGTEEEIDAFHAERDEKLRKWQEERDAAMNPAFTYQSRTWEQWQQRADMTIAMGAWLTEEEARVRAVERALDPPWCSDTESVDDLQLQEWADAEISDAWEGHQRAMACAPWEPWEVEAMRGEQ